MEEEGSVYHNNQEIQGPIRPDKVFSYFSLYIIYERLPFLFTWSSAVLSAYFFKNTLTVVNFHPHIATHALSSLACWFYLPAMACKSNNHCYLVACYPQVTIKVVLSRSFHLLFVCLITYGIARGFPRMQAFWITFLICFAYMSWAHIYRMTFDYGGFSADVSLWVVLMGCCVDINFSSQIINVGIGANYESYNIYISITHVI